MRPLLAAMGPFICVSAAACRKDAQPDAAVPPPSVARPAPDLGVIAHDGAAVAATRFVQHFYDWYGRPDAPFERAVHDSGSAILSPRLLEALRADIAAQAADSQEVVGLDWDPFLASQDPCPPYRVEQTYRRGDTVLVTVKGTCQDAAPRAGPDVVAEVLPRGSGWEFVDFRHGADAGSLLGDLAQLRASRR